MSRAEQWLATSFAGHCGATTANDRGDCSAGDRGNFALNFKALDWNTAIYACLAECNKCARCRYVSISLRWSDCSWYHDCENPSSHERVVCFRSGRVSNSLPALPPPPTIPSWSASIVQAAQGEPSSVAILVASDRPPPLPLDAALLHRIIATGTTRIHSDLLRALVASVNRAYAAAHGYDYVYARFAEGCGHRLPVWCQLPAAIALLSEHSSGVAYGNGGNGHSTRRRYNWVLAIDEDVAFNSANSFGRFLESSLRPHTDDDGASSSNNHPKRSCRGRCQPLGTFDPSDSDCGSDSHVAEEPPCLLVGKEIDGWPGVNGGVKFYRNSKTTHKLIHEWWTWPLRLPKDEQWKYLRAFPAEQNALNDAILSNGTLRKCIHVAPNRDLYHNPGRFTRHFTGVNVDKLKLFVEHWPMEVIDKLISSVPDHNVTACETRMRRVRLPDGLGSSMRSTQIETTRHCLDRMGPSSRELTDQLWPTAAVTRRGGGGGGGRRLQKEAENKPDLGLLISILHTDPPTTWSNVAHTLTVLKPKWSSLAIDLWRRPSNVSALDARQVVHSRYADVLSLFSRVLFLDTPSREGVNSHVRPSFSYRLHWHASFPLVDSWTHQARSSVLDSATIWPQGGHSEAVPSLLVGVDADVYVPQNLPIERLADVLAKGADKSSQSEVDAAEKRARDAWLRGRVPECKKEEEKGSKTKTTGNICEVVSTSHTPVWASPRDLSRLHPESRVRYAELGMFLQNLNLGNCCGRQNTAPPGPEKLRKATGAEAVILSRGPYCPPSTFFVVHRKHLKRLLSSFRLWQEAWDAKGALTKDGKRLRWEYTSCAMLTPGEAGLLLYYNHTSLEG